MSSQTDCLYERVYAAIMVGEPSCKVAQTREIFEAWRAGKLVRADNHAPLDIVLPGLPDTLQLVPPKQLSKRKITNPEGLAAHLHAIAHIEFNAINLALDAVYRFPAMNDDYIDDWLKVAFEEAYHYELLATRLAQLNHQYGDFSAHNGLWQMAIDTAGDCLARMALVPRVLEARGLDVTPSMIAKFEALNDTETVEILEIILRDEVGHVRTGSRWFYQLCADRDLPPLTTFISLVEQYSKGVIKTPFNDFHRLEAGFSRSELRHLAELGG